MPKLPAPFIAALEEDREALNMRFALRLRGGSRIDGAAFMQHLQEAVGPLIEQIHAILPERSRAAVTALYDVSLDLFAAALLGPEAKMTWVQRVWRELLPKATKLLTREPQRVAGCLSNAAFQVASQPGTRPQDWLERMQAVVPQCESTGEMLEAGKVAAWQAGLVQYRNAALDAAESLRPLIAALAMNLPVSMPAEELSLRVKHLREHVWLTAESAGSTQVAGMESVGAVGAFTGFGGLFHRPPVVESEDSRLFVSDGRWQWELLADRYGAWFRKLGAAPAKHSKPATRVAIDQQGNIRWGKQSLAAPHLAGATSFAATEQTLAVTIPTSHHVFLFSGPSGKS
jgi:hypothetical protein